MSLPISSKIRSRLFVSVESNGIFFTLSVQDSAFSDGELHTWKTSYPLGEILQPYWRKRKTQTSDFFFEACEHAEKLFGWSFMQYKRVFKTPCSGFGEGLSSICALMGDNSPNDILIPTQRSVNVLQRKDIDITSLFLPYLASVSVPVALLELNFDGARIYEFIPKQIGSTRRWEYKTTEFKLNSRDEILNRAVTGRISPYMTFQTSEEDALTAFANSLYWKPAESSSELINDLYRAHAMDILNELSKHVSIIKDRQGILISFGEIPAFIGDPYITQLIINDSFGLNGVWSHYVDTYHLFLPVLASTIPENVRISDIIPYFDHWVIPKVQSDSDVFTIDTPERELLAVSGLMYRYSVKGDIPALTVKRGKTSAEYKLPIGITNRNIIADGRKWPVVYGPTATDNHNKYHSWIERLHKEV